MMGLPVPVFAMLGGLASYYMAGEANRLGKIYGERKKIMDSNRMKRTADAKGYSKKNLVLAYVELGHKLDQAENTIADLRVKLDASQSVAKIHGDEMMKARRMADALPRCREEIRKLRALVAHYFDAPGES